MNQVFCSRIFRYKSPIYTQFLPFVQTPVVHPMGKRHTHRIFMGIMILLIPLCFGCDKRENPYQFSGYVEGEYTYFSIPISGRLEALHVHRGDQVDKGTLLWELESEPEIYAVEQARQNVAAAESTLRDMLAAQQRPEEIAVIQEQLEQAKANQEELRPRFERYQILRQSGTVTQEEIETSEAALRRNEAKIRELEQSLKVAKLSVREDRIQAQRGQIEQLRAVELDSQWRLSQKQFSTPKAGRIDDICFREGEWVAAGRPIISLLAPTDIRLRFFVPETQLSTIRIGETVAIKLDGTTESMTAKIVQVFTEAEFTPPIIYSNQTRAKLVFMVEAMVEPESAQKLHPGQPITVLRHVANSIGSEVK